MFHFGKKHKQNSPVDPLPVHFLGGPWDGWQIVPTGYVPLEIVVFTHKHVRGWYHSYIVQRDADRWRALYAGLHERVPAVTSDVKPLP